MSFSVLSHLYSTIECRSQDPYFRLAMLIFAWAKGKLHDLPLWFIWPDPPLLRLAYTERLMGTLFVIYDSLDHPKLPPLLYSQLRSEWLNQCALSLHRSILRQYPDADSRAWRE